MQLPASLQLPRLQTWADLLVRDLPNLLIYMISKEFMSVLCQGYCAVLLARYAYMRHPHPFIVPYTGEKLQAEPQSSLLLICLDLHP